MRVLQSVLTDSLRLFRFDKMNPSFASLLYHGPIIASKLYSISLFKYGILLIAHFSNVCCTIVKEMRGPEIFNLPGWTSQEPLHPVSSNSVVKQNGGVLVLFSRFRRGTENRRFNRIQKFFAEVFQITSRFDLAKKNFGVRCTLSIYYIFKK